MRSRWLRCRDRAHSCGHALASMDALLKTEGTQLGNTWLRHGTRRRPNPIHLPKLDDLGPCSLRRTLASEPCLRVHGRILEARIHHRHHRSARKRRPDSEEAIPATSAACEAVLLCRRSLPSSGSEEFFYGS